MNIIYLVNALCAINTWYGPWCDSGNIYPPCMATANCLVWANFGYHLYLHHNNYFLKWKKPVAKPAKPAQAAVESPLIEAEAEDTEVKKEEMSIEDRRKDLFIKQTDAFKTTTLIVSLWQLFILCFAYGIIHEASFLQCVDDGWRWEQTTICGSLFTLFHMMTIMMQTMMEIKIFVWIPQKEGLLDTECTNPDN